MDARIQQSVVANLSGRPAAVESGPFIVGIDPDTDSPGINYATPRPGAPITPADVDALVATFRAAARKPRLEYVTSAAPTLEALLVAAGFTVEARHEYLVCTPDTLAVPATPAGFTLRAPATDDDRRALYGAQSEAFVGAPVEVTDADVARMGRTQTNGGVVVMAVAADGTCAGGGLAMPPSDGVSEVAGIAVLPPYRRRGLAGAITAAVTSHLFAAGGAVGWLEASGEDSWRVYERIGYQPTGKRLYIALE
jgi:ribosomal protein S18 acetylase RimI-like enzyme